MSPLAEQEQQIQDNHEWCLHDPEVRRLHGGQVVVVHRKRILGAGANHLVAFQAAQRDPACPTRDKLAFVVVPFPDHPEGGIESPAHAHAHHPADSLTAQGLRPVKIIP